MPKTEFLSLLTLQAAEGKQQACFELLKKIFDTSSILEMQLFHSDEDPEIIMALQKWPSIGVFEEVMRQVHDEGHFKNSQDVIEFVQITRWKPVSAEN